LLFPGEEDFGIVPVEAQACGTPVIGYGRGGVTETIIPRGGRREPTGLLFDEQSADCLATTLQTFEKHAREFAPGAARRQALRFNHRRFEQELLAYLAAILHPTSMSARKAA
jgi:glycosyltransferase involved in cell wall biosynthesis